MVFVDEGHPCTAWDTWKTPKTTPKAMGNRNALRSQPASGDNPESENGATQRGDSNASS